LQRNESKRQETGVLNAFCGARGVKENRINKPNLKAEKEK